MGISFDSVEANRAFAEKYAFPYKLLSDTSRSVGVAYGAADSPSARSAKRISYVIDKGTIRHVYVVGKGLAAENPGEVLRDLKTDAT